MLEKICSADLGNKTTFLALPPPHVSVPYLGAATALQSKNRLIEGIGGGRIISGPSYPALFSTSDFDIFFLASKCHLHF